MLVIRRDIQNDAREDVKIDSCKDNQYQSKLWRYWLFFCQLRFGYCFFLLSLFVIVFAFSTIMELFFIIFLPSPQTLKGLELSNQSLIIALPIIIFLFGILHSKAITLFLDSFNFQGGLKHLRIAELCLFSGICRLVCCCCRPEFVEYEKSQIGNQSVPGESQPISGNSRENQNGFLEEKHQSGSTEESNLLTADSLENQKGAMENQTSVQVNALASANVARSSDPITFKKSLFSNDFFNTIVDIVQPFLFDVLFILACIWNLTNCTDDAVGLTGFSGLAQIGVWISMAYLVWFIFVEMIVLLVPALNRIYDQQLKKSEEQILNQYKEYQNILPILGSTLTSKFLMCWRTLSSFNCYKAQPDNLNPVRNDHYDRKAAEATQRKEENKACHNHAKACQIAIFSGALYLFGNFLTFKFFIVGFCFMMFSLLVFSHVLGNTCHRMRSFLGPAFTIFVTAFVVLSVALCYLAWQGGATADMIKGSLDIIPPVAKEIQNPVWQNDLYFYQVCSVGYFGLHILDINMLAAGAYLVENRTELFKTLHEDFDNTFLQDWTVKNAVVQNYMAFYEIHFPSLNTTVISVRGTCTGIDALQDMHYWFGISFLQLLTRFIFPVLNQLPESLIKEMLFLSAFPYLNKSPNYLILLDYVKEAKIRICGVGSAVEDLHTCRVLVTGHSLGGGMAALAASLNHLPGVSFSGPGLKFNSWRFGVSELALQQHVTTIKPDYDIVPAVDTLLGTIEEIACPYKSPLACHMPEVTALTLLKFCKDPRKRGWANTLQNLEKFYGFPKYDP